MKGAVLALLLMVALWFAVYAAVLLPVWQTIRSALSTLPQ